VRERREATGELEECLEILVALGELHVRLAQLLVRSPDLLDGLPRAGDVLLRREHHHRRRQREGHQAGDADCLVGDRERQRERPGGEVVRSQPAEALAPDRELALAVRKADREREQPDVDEHVDGRRADCGEDPGTGRPVVGPQGVEERRSRACGEAELR